MVLVRFIAKRRGHDILRPFEPFLFVVAVIKEQVLRAGFRICRQSQIPRGLNLDTAIERLIEARREGIERVKLYFIYGFPFERPEDVQGIVDFCAAPVAAGLRVRVSLNPFIPKPLTPLQWFPMLPLKDLKSKFTFLRDRLRSIGVRDVSGYSPREAVAQAQLIFSDESDAAVILDLAAGRPSADASPGTDPFAPKSKDQPFPWDILKTSVTREEMWREAEEILRSVSGNLQRNI